MLQERIEKVAQALHECPEITAIKSTLGGSHQFIMDRENFNLLKGQIEVFDSLIPSKPYALKKHIYKDCYAVTYAKASPEFDEMDRAYLKFTETLDEFMSAIKKSTKEW